MTVKKAYVDVIAFLEANQDKKVKSILADVTAMCEAKAGGGGGAASTFVKDEAGNVVAIRCFYHQTWMDPRVVPFGSKASSATGLNTMCKSGVSKWTKQQRQFKLAQEELLKQVADGTIQASDIAAKLAEAEEARKVIVPLEGNYPTFTSADECIAFHAANPDFVYEVPADETAEEATE